jgi:hypothetical protein
LVRTISIVEFCIAAHSRAAIEDIEFPEVVLAILCCSVAVPIPPWEIPKRLLAKTFARHTVSIQAFPFLSRTRTHVIIIQTLCLQIAALQERSGFLTVLGGIIGTHRDQ